MKNLKMTKQEALDLLHNYASGYVEEGHIILADDSDLVDVDNAYKELQKLIDKHNEDRSNKPIMSIWYIDGKEICPICEKEVKWKRVRGGYKHQCDNCKQHFMPI